MSSSFRRRARWIVYSLLAALAVLALGLLIYARSGHPDRWARGRLIEALGHALGRPVTVERVTLQYLPPGAVVEGLRTAAPLIEAERVEVQVSARALLRGQVVAKDVEVRRPVLRWDLDSGLPLIEPVDRDATGEPRLTLRRLRLIDGAVLIGSQRRALEADVEGLSVLMTNVTGEPGTAVPWSGGIAFKRSRFSLGDLQLAGAAGSITFQADAGGHVSLPSVHVRADGVEITGRGEVLPGKPLRGRFLLDGSLDPSSSALVRPLPQFGARHLDLSLEVALRADGVNVTGTFTADEPTIDPDRRADADGPALPWNGRRASGRLEAGDGRLSLTGEIEGMAGGRMEGTYEGSQDDPRRHTVQVSADRLDLREVLSHVELPGDPLVTFSSSVSGDARLQWEGPDIGGAVGTARLAFEARPGEMPLSGQADLQWRGQRVTVISSALRVPGADLAVSGPLDLSRSPAGLGLAVDVEAEDATPLALFLEDRFATLFRDAQGKRRLPMIPTDLEGSFEAQMKATGDTGRPHVEARIASGGLRLSLPSDLARRGAVRPPESARVPLALDTLMAGITWDPDHVTLSIDRATGEALDVWGEVTIATSGAGAALRRMRLEAEEIPSELLGALAGGPLEAAQAAGAMRLSADLSTPSAGSGLTGPVSLTAPRLEIRGFMLEEVQAHGSLDGSTVILEGASLAALGGTASGAGSWPGRLDVTFAGLDLAALQARMGGPAMTGTLDARGSLMGGGSEPQRVEGSVAGHDVIIGGMDVGNVTGTLEGSPGTIRFDLRDAADALHATGEIVRIPVGAPAIEARLVARPFGLDRLRPILPPDALAGLRGDADADMTISGPLSSLRELTVRARVDRVSIAAGEYTVTNEGPLFLTLMDGFLTLTSGRLVGDRTDLELAGSMNLGGEREATLRVAGTFDLGLLEIISPEARAVGPATVDIRIVEREAGTTYAGEVAVQGASLRHPALPQPVERLRGVAAFEEGGLLRIQQLTFDTGGGHVTGEGWARFEGAAIGDAHLALQGRGIRAELLPSLRAFFDADVTLDKDGPDIRADGHVNILRAIYSRAFGLEPTALLLRNREFGPARQRRGGPTVFLDIRIDAEKDLWIRNEDALIEAAASLRLSGTLAEPELNGRITALEGGTYRFRDVTYRIDGGAIEFTDVTRIDPELDITASTRVQEYDVKLKITGRFSRPLYELSSEPPLPQSDIVWLLVTGRTLSESGTDVARGAAESQVAGYLAAPVAGAVTAPLGRLLGVSSLQIDPTLLHGTADPTARLTVSKRIAQDLLFTYSSSLGDSGQEVYQVEYNPGRIWDLIGTRDLDGSVGADVRIRRRWRAWGWGDERPPTAPAPGIQEPAGRMRVGTLRVLADVPVGSEASLKRRLDFGEGDPLVRGDLLEGREKIRERYVEHGYPAAQVDVVESEPRPGPPVLVDVTFTIQAGPRYDVAIEGDVGERRLRKAVRTAWQEPVLLEDLVEEARLAALRALKGRGRYLAEVEARIETPDPQQRLVTLQAEAGPKVRVRSVAIIGNAQMPEERIRRQMLTHPGGFMKLFGQGLLKENVLEEDVAAIRGLYQANGFLEVRLAPPRVRIVEDGTAAEITVEVEEGLRYNIGSVAIEGEVPGVEGAEMLKAAGLPPGSDLTEAAVGEAADRLRALLDHHGYSQARVISRIEGPPAQMRVVYAVSPGPRVRIASVTFTGNKRTNDRTIHREITLDAGDYLTRADTLESQRNLFRLGVFRSVEIQTTPVPGEPDKVNVNFELVEGPPILTAWGVGYDSEDGPRGSFELADNNLFGTRRSAGIFLRASAVSRRAQLTLRDPNLFGERIDTLISSFLEQEETDSYTADRLGIVGQLSRRVGTHTTLYGSYRLEDVDLSDVRVSPDEETEQTVRLGSMGVSIAHDTRDDIVYPTSGGLSSLDLRTYGPIWGSEEQFLKVFASATVFKDIGHKMVWASSVRAGLISSRDIPITERFFAGGDTTLRGFEYRTVGPLDPETGEPLGGEGLFLFNQELRFPLYKAFTGVVFYDAGNVYADFTDYDITDLRHVLGLGLRVSTPVGPFRVEFGHKMDRERGESAGEIFFSIGQAF